MPKHILLERDGWALCVNAGATRFEIVSAPDGDFEHPHSFRTSNRASALARRIPPNCPFSVAEVVSFGETASEAAPEFFDAVVERERRYWRSNPVSHDYAYALWTEGPWRISLAPDVAEYLLQHVDQVGHWRIKRRSAHPEGLRQWLRTRRVAQYGGSRVDGLTREIQSALVEFLETLPDDPAANGVGPMPWTQDRGLS